MPCDRTATRPAAPAPRRALYRRPALIAIIFACLGAVGSGSASAASMPREGVFEDCPLDTAMQICTERLHVMQRGGIRVVLIPASGAALDSLAAYAAAAHSLGMSVMWELSDPGWWRQPATGTGMAAHFPAFAAACGCDQNRELLAFVAQWLGALPSTYGYYAADDSMLAPSDQTGVASYVAQIKRQDPSRTVMISGFQMSQARQYEGIADVVGQEIYPVTTTSLLPTGAHRGAWNSIAQKVVGTQRLANTARKPSAFILQAFTWGDNLDDGVAARACSPGESKRLCYASLRYPSAREQLQLRNEILLRARPALILWWSFPGTFGQAGTDTYSIYPTGSEAASRWAGLSAAITAPMPRAKIATSPLAGGRPRASAACTGRRRGGGRGHARRGAHQPHPCATAGRCARRTSRACGRP